MVILVTDKGFSPDDWTHGFVPLAAVCPDPGADVGPLAVDLGTAEMSPREWQMLLRILPRAGLIRIRLRHFGDTAALDLAKALRRAGFAGRLRAHGAVLAGQYTLARRAGFSEIELMPHQAQRQPREHWLNHPAWSPVRRASGAGRGNGHDADSR